MFPNTLPLMYGRTVCLRYLVSSALRYSSVYHVSISVLFFYVLWFLFCLFPLYASVSVLSYPSMKFDFFTVLFIFVLWVFFCFLLLSFCLFVCLFFWGLLCIPKCVLISVVLLLITVKRSSGYHRFMTSHLLHLHQTILHVDLNVNVSLFLSNGILAPNTC